MFTTQTDLFFQLAKKRFLRGFSGHHAPLGKLPGIAVTHAATPEYPAILAGNDNPDVQPESLVINNACHGVSTSRHTIADSGSLLAH